MKNLTDLPRREHLNSIFLYSHCEKCCQTPNLNGIYKGNYFEAVSYTHPLSLFCLSHSCVSYVHEAPGSVRHQKGNICNSSAPPGLAVLTGRRFVQCTQWGYAKNVDKGGQDRQTGRRGEEKMCLHPLLSLLPTPHCFI